MFKDVPTFLVRKLKQVRLPTHVENALWQRYGMEIRKSYHVARSEVDFAAINAFMGLSY